MSDKNKTAVEQLHEQSVELLSKYSKGEITISDFMIQHHNLIYPALDNEKQQIMKAVEDGFNEGSKHPEDVKIQSAEQYYTETFES